MTEWPHINDAYAWTGGAGIMGRLMFHARMVQQGRRKPLSWALLFDLPIALGMGWVAYGLCVWAGLASEPTISVAIAASYLGPYSVDRLFGALAEKYFGKSEFPKPDGAQTVEILEGV